MYHPWVNVTLTFISDLVSRICIESGAYILFYNNRVWSIDLILFKLGIPNVLFRCYLE